jgi:hypothetical protein
MQVILAAQHQQLGKTNQSQPAEKHRSIASSNYQEIGGTSDKNKVNSTNLWKTRSALLGFTIDI